MWNIAPAACGDAAAIATVLAANADDLSLFQRDTVDVERHTADFLVARDGAAIVGCAAVHFHASRRAEILSVAVHPSRHGVGVGRALLAACLARASVASARVWLATRKPEYFARFGFERCWRWGVLLAPPWTLVTKLRAVFQQPRSRWLAALVGSHVFMRSTRLKPLPLLG